jgi:hypothetical protein
MLRPLVLIDVDGVLIPDQAPARPPGYRDYVVSSGEHVWLNPQHGPMLLKLAQETGAELAWATSRWISTANQLIGPLIGLPDLPYAPVPEWPTDILKADTIVPWTGGRPFAWFEDVPAETRRGWELVPVGQRALILQVSPVTGLRPEHVRAAGQWLKHVQSAKVPIMPY